MKEKIVAFIESKLLDSSAKIEFDEDLLNTGLLDSIGVVKLIEYLEGEFDVSIPPDDMVIEYFVSVNAIEQYLSSRN